MSGQGGLRSYINITSVYVMGIISYKNEHVLFGLEQPLCVVVDAWKEPGPKFSLAILSELVLFSLSSGRKSLNGLWQATWQLYLYV